MKFEQLNIDMNFFLLLKNELSLHFLRQTENIVATVKLALKIYVNESEKTRAAEEAQELRVLERILNNLPIELESEEEETKQQVEEIP